VDTSSTEKVGALRKRGKDQQEEKGSSSEMIREFVERDKTAGSQERKGRAKWSCESTP